MAQRPNEGPDERHVLLTLDGRQSGLQVLEEVVEGKDAGTMRIRGVATYDNAYSINKRIYPTEANELALENSNRRIAEGGRATMFTSHDKAGVGWFASEGLPIGRITRFEREGTKIVYYADILPTTEGKDVQTLLRGDAIGETSIRGDPQTWKSRTGIMDGVDVEVMEEYTIVGVDFTSHPGIPGAGVDRILESALVYRFEEDEMKWSELTLEQLSANAPQLLEEHRQVCVEELGAKHAQEIQTLTDKLVAAAEEVETLRTAAPAAPEEGGGEVDEAVVSELRRRLAIAEACVVGSIPRRMFEAINAAKPATAEEVAEMVQRVRDEAIDASLAPREESGKPGGKAHPPQPPKQGGVGLRDEIMRLSA